MKVVIFPALNLSFKFSRVAFSIFGIEIYKYAICIVTGILVAVILSKFSKEKFNIEYEQILNCIIIGVIFGILGARIYYVIFNLDYYIKNIAEIFSVQNGGLAIYGGLIFGSISIIIYCKYKKINILDLFDYLAPFVAIAQSFGRWGNFFNVEAYGYETNSILRMGIYTKFGYIEVHPVFLYESLGTLLIFIILRFLQKKRIFKGQIAIIYCMLYSILRFFLEGLRTDSLMFFNIRVSQALSLFVFIISSILLLHKKTK